jgi:hypothetical protein
MILFPSSFPIPKTLEGFQPLVFFHISPNLKKAFSKGEEI